MKFQTLFQTFPTSVEAALESRALWATKALPRTWTQLAERVKSDLAGGDDSTTFKTSDSCAPILLETSSKQAENISDMTE